MSPPASQSFRIEVKVNRASRSDSVDQARTAIFSRLGIKTIPYGDGGSSSGANNPLDVVDRLNERLRTIISKSERFAVKNSITLLVTINGGWTMKTAKLDLLGSLFFECVEVKLAAAVQDVIDDLKEFQRKISVAQKKEREKKIVEDALSRILVILSISDYCSIWPIFDKGLNRFKLDFIQHGPTHALTPAKEEDFLWDPDVQKGEIRALLHDILKSGFPLTIYYYKWHIYREDPEDFDAAEMEFQNLIGEEEIDETSDRYVEQLIRERREAYQRAIREAGGALSFAANFFFDHVVGKIVYAIPVIGEVMMIYDLAQLAVEFPDDVRFFSKILLDEEEI